MKNEQAGFCIVCGTSINWNINSPFCKECKLKVVSIHRGYNEYLNFCHGCGCATKSVTKAFPLCKIICRPFDRKSDSIDHIYLQRLNRYKQLTDIHSVWDSSPISDYMVIDEFSIFDLLEIIESEGLMTNDVFANSISSNKRIMNTLWRWEFGVPVSIPKLDLENNLFIDGRHRVLAAYHLNEIKIPIYYKTKK